MPLSLRNCTMLLLAPVVFAGCADLKEVGHFAVTSQQVMDRDRTAPFGYYSYFHDSAYIYNYLPDKLQDVDCHCDAAKQADENIANEYALLGNYFAALARFADPKASINFAPMGSPLPAGVYGNVTVSSTEVSIATNIAQGLTALTTTGYKAKKLPGFMATYRDSVAPLITLLRIRADNLSARIVNLRTRLDFVADSLIHFAAHKEVRMPVLFAYEQKRKELEGTLLLYQQRERDLEAIIAGGQLIVDNIDKLHTAEFKEKMKSLVNAIALNTNIKL